MINDDYVNGVNITYSNSSRKEGESNFDDIIAVINSIYGADPDKYESDVMEILNIYLIYHIHIYQNQQIFILVSMIVLGLSIIVGIIN